MIKKMIQPSLVAFMMMGGASVLFANQLTDGDFSANPTEWQFSGGVTLESSALKSKTRGMGHHAVTTVQNQAYKVDFDVVNYTKKHFNYMGFYNGPANTTSLYPDYNTEQMIQISTDPGTAGGLISDNGAYSVYAKVCKAGRHGYTSLEMNGGTRARYAQDNPIENIAVFNSQTDDDVNAEIGYSIDNIDMFPVSNTASTITTVGTTSYDYTDNDTFDVSTVDDFELADANSWDLPTLVIVGGADAGLFELNETISYWPTKVHHQLKFKTKPTVGTYKVQVAASDCIGDSAPAELTITVPDGQGLPANDAPIFDFSNASNTQTKSLKEGAELTFTTPKATDADGDTVTYTIEAGLDADKFELVGGALKLKDSDANTKNDLNFETPSDADADNVYEVNIKADDSKGGTAVAKFSLTVTNAKPQATLADETVLEWSENSTAEFVNVGGSDANGATLTYDVTTYDRGFFTIDSSGNLRLSQKVDFENPEDSNAGNDYKVIWQVRDKPDDSSKVEREIKIKIIDVNEAPTKVGTIATHSNVSGSAIGSVDIKGFFTDPDTTGTDASFRTLNYTATGLPAGLTISATSGVISGTPTTAGTTQVVVTATDKSGAGLATAQSAFDWVITQANHAPVVTLEDHKNYLIDENTNILAQIGATDEDGDTLTYTLSDYDSNLFEVDTNGNIKFTATPDFENPKDTSSGSGDANNNVYDLKWKVTDPSGKFVERTIHVTVYDVNEQPTIRYALTDKKDDEKKAINSFNVSSYFDDPDTEKPDSFGKLEFSVANLPEGLTYNSDGDILGTPTKAETKTVKVTAFDGGNPNLEVVQTFEWVINDKTAPSAPNAVSILDGGDEKISKVERDAGVDVEITLPADAKEGDVITVTTGTGTPVTHTVTQAEIDADTPVTVKLPTANIPETGTLTAEVMLTDKAGNVGAKGSDTSSVDTTAPTAPTVVIDDGGDDKVSKAERDAGVDVAVTLPADAKDGDVITVTTGTGTPVTHTVTQGEIDAGTAVIVKLPTNNIPETGTLTAEVNLTDKVGNVGAKGTDSSEMDTTAPTTLQAPKVEDAPDTNNTKPEITGECTTGDTITAQVGGIDITPTATCTDGKYSITPADPIADGGHEITVKAKDPSGNETPKSPETDVNVDTTAPSAPSPVTIKDGGDEKISKAEREAGVDVEITLPNDAKDGDVITVTTGTGTPVTHIVTQAEIDVKKPVVVAIPTANIPADGTLTAEVTLTDKAGNEGAKGNDTSEVDATPPTGLGIPEVEDAPDTNNSRPAITGTCITGDVITAQVDGTDIDPSATCTDGKYSITPADPIDDGDHNITVKAKDPSGNESDPSGKKPVNVDTKAPSAPKPVTILDGGDEKISKEERDAGVKVEVTLPADAKEGDVIVVDTKNGTPIKHTVTQTEIDAKNPIVVEIPTANIPENGTMTAEVTLTDKAGNRGKPAKDTSSVDSTVPNKPTTKIEVENGPDVNSTTPKVTGECVAGNVVTVYDNGVEMKPTAMCDANNTFVIVPEPGFTEGEHNLTRTETDDHNNTSEQGPVPATTIRVDVTAPSAPKSVTVKDGGDGKISKNERDAGVDVEVELNDDIQVGDVLTIDTKNGTAIKHTVTQDDVTAKKVVVKLPKENIPEDGLLTVEVTITDVASNQGEPTTGTSNVDTTAPIVDIDKDSIKVISITDDANSTDENGTVIGGTSSTSGFLEFRGHTEPNTTVRVRFPNGEETTVRSDDQGNYYARSRTTQNISGDIKVTAEDSAGNGSAETKSPFTAWYKTEVEDIGTVVTYGKDDTIDDHKSIITISKELDVERVEDDNNVIKLNITGPESDAPATIAEEAENGCDLSSYKAFVTLFEEDGSVETGYTYADPTCGKLEDSTVYDGKRLKFVPGTESRMEKTEDKGGMVIITDAKLEKATKFGER